MIKKLILKTLTFFLILTGLFSSCKDPELKINYPIDIPFTEYSLTNTSCRWMNLPYDEQIIIINSSEELEKHIFCSEGSYPEIDFSKHSLLLASGKTKKEIDEVVTKGLQQLSSNKYELSLEIAITDIPAIETWNMAFFIEKINDNSVVELNLTLNKVIIELELGVYKQEGFTISATRIEFIDRENLAFIAFNNPYNEYFKYEIVEDSIRLITNFEVFDTYYFYIISSIRFGMGASSNIPHPYISIFRKINSD